jgi:hypothetical protein
VVVVMVCVYMVMVEAGGVCNLTAVGGVCCMLGGMRDSVCCSDDN